MSSSAAIVAPLELYTSLPATRGGPLFLAFSYPTKISAESIAVFIASHTKPGDTILDSFGGSGTTGLAAHLCANPTPEVLKLAESLQASVEWGPRNAVVYELSALGSFVGRTMCSPPDVGKFVQAAEELITTCEQKVGSLYAAKDELGKEGYIRHAIWSDVLVCSSCDLETSFWEAAVTLAPASIAQKFKCPNCHQTTDLNEMERVCEAFQDSLTGESTLRRKRLLKHIYGETKGRKWSRPANSEDEAIAQMAISIPVPACVPIAKIPWGDLHRAGYHKGITHAHHFYTRRNLLVMGTIWEEIEKAPNDLRDALKLLALSYNATHSTLMTRVVVKSGEKDFVLTGAQTGVLYISSLPVEKNIFRGLRRKIKTIATAFSVVANSHSSVRVVCGDSRELDLPDKSVDYVFTDPPFGGYIPYAEINFFNEVWLGKTTDVKNEIIVSQAQKKTVTDYSTMLSQVFTEIARTLKDTGKATIVFHSAKADVWTAFQNAYRSAGFHVMHSGVLDKKQGSFKQVTAGVSVKGDPLVLLSKSGSPSQSSTRLQSLDADVVLAELLRLAAKSDDEKECTPERLYSRFVTRYLEHGLPVPLDAAGFYEKAKPLIQT